MFRRLERRVVTERLDAGFTGDGTTDVDGFLEFSLSVQNRRKSRMGHSLEHHLAAVFRAFGIRHDRGAVTEHGHKPDFLFPDRATYIAAPPVGTPKLAMLGAKSTCKDRWRQVLAEAAGSPGNICSPWSRASPNHRPARCRRQIFNSWCRSRYTSATARPSSNGCGTSPSLSPR